MHGDWQRRLLGLSRVLAFALGLQALTLCWWAQHVHAGAQRLLERVADDALRYARAFHQGQTQTVSVNGLLLELAVGSTHDAVSQVLQHYRAQCRRWTAAALAPPITPGLRAEFAARASWLPEPSLHAETNEQGYLACLEPNPTSAGLEPLTHAIRAFVADLDLSHVGRVLYVVARRQAQTTTYVIVRSTGALRLVQAFPRTGDAPGVDVPGLPRPRDTRRVLSAWQAGASPVISVYEAPHELPKALLERYRAQLLAAGYRVSIASNASGPSPRALVASRAGVLTLISACGDALDRAELCIAPLL